LGYNSYHLDHVGERLEKIACTHCHLEFDKSQLIVEEVEGKTCYFCCKGCQGVYHLLRSEGLDTFYEKRGDTKLDRPKEVEDGAFAKFDLEGFAKKYVKTTPEGFHQINLIIEGIHCSACVWLNEKVLHKTPGIIEAEINYTTHKAKVVWDPHEIKLSRIFRTIASIGYNAYPYDASLQEERANRARRDYYARLLVGIFATMNIMWIAIAEYTGYFTGMRSDVKDVLNVAEFVLATPTLFYTGWVYFRGAWYGLKNRFVNMDFLVATGATLAWLYSIYAMITHTGEVYFDSVTMIITFVFVGKYLEVLSKKRAVDTLDAMTSSIPTEVIVIKEGEKSLVAVEEIKPGDMIEVRSGDKVVIDGIISTGSASVDLSSLTGESEPVLKREGEELLSGAIVLDGVLRYEARRAFEDSMLSTIVTMLEESMTKKPKIEQIANRVSGYFSFVILSIALLTFVGWYLYTGGFEHALIVAISVIVIACPCALGLATPVATLVALGEGAKHGLLFKEAAYLETMAKGDILLVDKTGTLTLGEPRVVAYHEIKPYDPKLLYALVKSSTHPISKGVANYLQEHHSLPGEMELEEIRHIQARGIKAKYRGQKLLGGNQHLMSEEGIGYRSGSEGSLFLFAINGEVVAEFELEDMPKPDTKRAIEAIKKMGIRPVMLTGDNEKIAKRVAKEVGIEEVHHSLLPADKAEWVDRFHREGHTIIMVGDGINDAIALARSDIAIAMGSGADIAVEVSDVVLLHDTMSSLASAIRLSRMTFKNIKQNLALSLLYNLITIPLAVAGYVIPLVAALSMSLSSLVVVANAMRIKRFSKEEL